MENDYLPILATRLFKADPELQGITTIGPVTKRIDVYDTLSGKLILSFIRDTTIKFTKNRNPEILGFDQRIEEICTYVISKIAELSNKYVNEQHTGKNNGPLYAYIDHWTLDSVHLISEKFGEDTSIVQYCLNNYVNMGLIILEKVYETLSTEGSSLFTTKCETVIKLFDRSNWWWEQFTGKTTMRLN